MIRFLTKGLLRDRSRSLFPVVIITITVGIVIFTIGFMKGTMNSVFLDTAVIISGHEKVVTRAYKEESQMLPNDLALLDVDQIIKNLNKEKFFAANITHIGILVSPKPKTSSEFIDKWIVKARLSNIEPFIICLLYTSDAADE